MALSLSERFPESQLVKKELVKLISEHAKDEDLKKIPSAAVLLASSVGKGGKANPLLSFHLSPDFCHPTLFHTSGSTSLSELSSWAPAGPVEGLELLSSPISSSNDNVKAYALKCLASARPDQVTILPPFLS